MDAKEVVSELGIMECEIGQIAGILRRSHQLDEKLQPDVTAGGTATIVFC